MSSPFDPYYQWLGIHPKHHPPDHYRLLGIERFEANAQVIESAADRQMAHVRSFQTGKHAAASQALLNEISAARRCLLNADSKARYDATLSDPAPSTADEPDGLAFGEYMLLDQIGTGGTGQVFKAQHRTLGRVVALKILSQQATKSPQTVSRFRRKVRLMAQFDHPHLVPAFDAGLRDGVHYLVMAYVDGDDLGAVARRFHPLPVDYVVAYIIQAAEGLGYAHGQGVLHRNVKPSNVLVDQQGVVKVIGLGLARTEVGGDESVTRLGTAVGTLDYMSPEQARDSTSVDARSDVYSLGYTLYTVLTQRLPYPVKAAVKKALAHRAEPIPRLQEHRPEVSDSLEAVYHRMVAKSPADRFQSMGEVVAALNAIGHDLIRAPERSAGEGQEDGQLSDFLSWVADRHA